MMLILNAVEQPGFGYLETAGEKAQECCHADVILNPAHRFQQSATVKAVAAPKRFLLKQLPQGPGGVIARVRSRGSIQDRSGMFHCCGCSEAGVPEHGACVNPENSY